MEDESFLRSIPTNSEHPPLNDNGSSLVYAVHRWSLWFAGSHWWAAKSPAGGDPHFKAHRHPMCFLAQFYCHPERLPLPGILCLQLYQNLDAADPLPMAIAVPLGAKKNTLEVGVAKPGVIPHDVGWIYRLDPDEAEDWQTDLAESKVAGVCYFWDILDPDERLILQLRERPSRLNFGGYTLVVAGDGNGRLRTTLG